MLRMLKETFDISSGRGNVISLISLFFLIYDKNAVCNYLNQIELVKEKPVIGNFI